MAGVLSGVGDMLFGDQSAQDKAAKAALDAAKAQYENLAVPELEDIDPELYQYLGDLSLEGIEAGDNVTYENVGSEFEGLSSDPLLRDKQLAGMAALDDIIAGGGMTLADKANLSRVQNEAAAGDAGRRGAILQGMQQRGMGGSGMELLAQLQSSQAATNRANQAGLDIAGDAQSRALDAIMQQANMAGGVRGQDFGEATTKASAQDAIARFNAQNSLSNDQFNKQNQLDTAKFNANTANQAAQMNNAAKQNISNMNTSGANDAQMYNKSQKQMNQFDMDSKKAGAMADQYAQQAQYQQNKGAQEAAKAGQTMSALGSMAGAAMMFSDENEKEEIEPLSRDEIREFLGAINPKKYKYKNPNKAGTRPGERMGFMLQDVQDTKLGKKITHETPDGKLAYDKDNLQGIMLAALSDITKERT